MVAEPLEHPWFRSGEPPVILARGRLVPQKDFGIVSTDCPSGPREILDGGKYGALVPVGDVDAPAETMERALCRDAARPRQESGLPFEQDVVDGRYLQTLVGT